MSYAAFCLGSAGGNCFSDLIDHQSSSHQVMKERAKAALPGWVESKAAVPGWVELNSTVIDAMDAVDASASMVDASGLELTSPSSVLSEAGAYNRGVEP